MSEETSVIKTSSPTHVRAKRKKKANQIPFGILLLLVIAGIAVFLIQKNRTMALFWVFGISFGFVLQKARFCFTASLRDPWITGSTSVTRAVLIAIAIATIGFTAIKYGAFANGQAIPGQSYIFPISITTAIGGLMFGIGMVIAGGCASGTLMRVGEGFGMQMLGLLFFVIGSLLGAYHMGWWTEHFDATAPRIFLPDVFGWLGAVVVQLALIFVLYIVADVFEKRKMGETENGHE